MSTVRFSRVYCYMKLQGYRRLVNVTRINYIMILLSLLTEASVALQRYAIDGAIQIKSVEENTQEGEASPCYVRR